MARRLGVLSRRGQFPRARRGEANRRIEHARRRRLGEKRDGRRRRDFAIAQRERVIAAEQHDADARNVLRDALGGFDTRAIGHVHVEEHDIGQNVFRALAGFATRGHLRDDGVAESAQQIGEQRARVVVVLGDQNADTCSRFSHHLQFDQGRTETPAV